MKFLIFLFLFSGIGFSQDDPTYEVGENWVTRYLRSGGSIRNITGLVLPRGWERATTWNVPPVSELPKSFNWNDIYRLQEVRNQRSCGSC